MAATTSTPVRLSPSDNSSAMAMGAPTPDYAMLDPCDSVQNPEQSPDVDTLAANQDTAEKDSSNARVLTPPTSEDMGKRDEPVESLNLSDAENDEDEEEDIGEIEPDHYWDGGRIPVFKPTMRQFRDFQKFISKVDKYGMRSGIVKVIPPKEWKESLPDLSEAVKTIRVKNPITQEFAGTHGTYTQANIEKQRSYNLVQWKAITMESNHQPPAKRGERRRQAEVSKPRVASNAKREPREPKPASPQVAGVKRGRGRPKRNAIPSIEEPEETVTTEETEQPIPPTPVSNNPADEQEGETPKVKEEEQDDEIEEEPTPSRKRGRPPKVKRESHATPKSKRKDKTSTPKSTPKPKGDVKTSVTSRRMNYKRETYEVDEEVFKGFDYHYEDVDQFTPERCKELEDVYWRTINYGTPMYGADMPGSLFKDDTECWNVAKLPNLLDVLGTKVPGVNTAYLYLGMWKATFAWHLEDVDLYSINYIHFGAPKQWYSISQEDARKFEAAMKKIWPNDAKHCDQFLRHKTYLISPEKLKSQFNITVNKLVHYEGEFVITYPYGYHSGFNIGYNCAESVNFANEDWLNYGRISKKCNCEVDSVWVDVYEIERKLRGEPTPEFHFVTDDEMEDDGEETPIKAKKKPGRKRKRTAEEEAASEKKLKKVKIRVKTLGHEPCMLCPNDIKYDVLLPTDNGMKAHRLCALYTPETYIADENGFEKVYNVNGIDKARLELRCMYCRSKKGTCFQCSSKKCARAYHATCAAAAGVQIDTGPVPTWGEDGTEYVCEGYDFRCRFHRPKRPKTTDVDALERNSLVLKRGRSLKAGDVIQALYFDGDIFGAVVIENRPGEMSCVVDVLPDGDRIEVEWKWILVLDPTDSERPKPSADAKPLPQHLHRHETSKNKRQDGVPEEGDAFFDPFAIQKWAEFKNAQHTEIRNPFQTKVDVFKSDQLWHYVPLGSTDTKPQYTHDPAKLIHNPKSSFLDSVRPAPMPFVARHSMPSQLGKMAIPAQYTKSFINSQSRTSLPGATSIPMSGYYSSHLPWQNAQSPMLAPRPLASYTTSGHTIYPTANTGSARSASFGSQHMAAYQSTFQQALNGPRSSMSMPTASPQDLMKSTGKASNKVPAINTALSQPRLQPTVYKMDNSRPRNYYALAESRYVSQPYYNAQKLQPAPSVNIQPIVPTASHKRTISREHSMAVANILASETATLMPEKSNELDHMPFTTPSQRPEVISSVLVTNGSPIQKERQISKPEAVHGYMEQVKRARAASNRFNNSDRLIAASAAMKQAKKEELEPSKEDTQSGALDISTSALFSSLIRADLTPTPEPQARNSQSQGQAVSTPKSNAAEVEFRVDTPERPEFSPLSDAGMV